jgi:hypothetical protein
MARSEPPKSATVVAAGVVEMSLRGASDDVERLVAKMRSEGIPVWRVPVQALNDGRNYSLNVEVDVKNTGNIGLLVNVKVSWPQSGNVTGRRVEEGEGAVPEDGDGPVQAARVDDADHQDPELAGAARLRGRMQVQG